MTYTKSGSTVNPGDPPGRPYRDVRAGVGTSEPEHSNRIWYYPLPRLFSTLLAGIALICLSLLAPPAFSQQQGLDFFKYEIGVEVNGCFVTMRVTDAVTGEFYFEEDIVETGNNPDFEIDTNGQNAGDLDQDLPEGVLYLIQFWVEPGNNTEGECPSGIDQVNYVW